MKRLLKRIFVTAAIATLLGLLAGLLYATNMLVVKTWDVTNRVVTGPETLTSVDALQTLIVEQYGVVPKKLTTWEIEKTVLDEGAYDGTATFELWRMTVSSSTVDLHVVVLIPNASTTHPALIVSNFCPNHLRYPEFNIPKPSFYFSMCEGGSMNGFFVNSIFGEYIASYPYQAFIERGIIMANVYLGELVADDPAQAQSDFEALTHMTGEPVESSVAAWAFAYQAVNQALEADPRVRQEQTAIYGHSRDGKAALLAAALDNHIDLTIAHQSGKGGAALWQREVGESKTNILAEYSHWFAPRFAENNQIGTTLDQHQLIAAVAPRPLLLSAAWLDNWGDPAGVLMAALAATPTYNNLGATGITTGVLSRAFDPTHALTFFIRPYTHGVRASDWEAFLRFIDFHFVTSPASN